MAPLESSYLTEDDLESMGIRSVGKNVRISQDATVVGLHNVRIGDNVRIDSYVTVLAGRGPLSIGSNVHIEPSTSLVAHGSIRIGNFCTLSHGCRLFTASTDYSGQSFTNSFPDPRYHVSRVEPITLEDHVIVGGNSVVMPGVKIGEGAAIGALSFVRSDVDEWGIYGGNPMKFLRRRSSDIKALGYRVFEGQRGEEEGLTGPMRG